MGRGAAFVGLCAVVLALAAPRVAADPAPAAGPGSPAWVLVDVGTGRVLATHDPHVLRRPASTIKLLTLLTAHRLVADDTRVSVPALATSMPAPRVGLVRGQAWSLSSLTAAMLLASANDAAVTMAEGTAGSLDAFATAMQHESALIGLVDHPRLEDPTGLDHTFDHDGGDWISAWDLALVARWAMDDPGIASVARLTTLDITDPTGRVHRLENRNRLLGSYAGATGLKTGFTHAAGNCLVATAAHGDRTMLAVVMGSHHVYGDATRLLDLGFATPATQEVGPRLDGRVETTRTSMAALPAAPVHGARSPARAYTAIALVSAATTAAGVVLVVLAIRRRRRAAAQGTRT